MLCPSGSTPSNYIVNKHKTSDHCSFVRTCSLLEIKHNLCCKPSHILLNHLLHLKRPYRCLPERLLEKGQVTLITTVLLNEAFLCSCVFCVDKQVGEMYCDDTMMYDNGVGRGN